MSDLIQAGSHVDKLTTAIISAVNKLNSEKSPLLEAGSNITITPQQDGSILISASGGGGSGNVDDVQSDNVSVVDQNGIAHIDTMMGATDQANGAKGLVPAPSIADKDKVLKGDGTWGSVSGGSSTLSDLTDTNIQSPSDGQVLTYDGTNQKWINGTGGGSSSGIQYDDTERVIGTFFGKTLYQKTFHDYYASGVTVLTIQFNIQNLGNIIRLDGVLMQSNSTTTYNDTQNVLFGIVPPASQNILTVESALGYGIYDSTGIKLTRSNVNAYGTNPHVFVTIQYTKATN